MTIELRGNTLLIDCEACNVRTRRYCEHCYGAGTIGMSNPFLNAASIAHGRVLARVFALAESFHELPSALVLDGIDYLNRAEHFAPAMAARRWDCADELIAALAAWAREYLKHDEAWRAESAREAANG